MSCLIDCRNQHFARRAEKEALVASMAVVTVLIVQAKCEPNLARSVGRIERQRQSVVFARLVRGETRQFQGLAGTK